MTLTFSELENQIKNYKKTNLELFEKKPLKKSVSFDVPDYETKIQTILQANSKQKPKIEIIEQKNVEFEILPFEKAFEKHKDKILSLLNNEQKPKNQFQAFPNAFFNSGYFVYIKSAKPDSFLHLNLVFENGCIAKNLYFAEPQIQGLTIIQNISSEKDFALSTTTNIKNESKISLATIYDKLNNGFVFNNSLIEKDSELLLFNVFADVELMNFSQINNLVKQGSNYKQYDLVLFAKEQKLNFDLLSLHSVPDAKSFTVLKGVLADKARTSFDGMIKVLPKAQRTDGLLEAHGMLLSPESKLVAIPGLEIEADDVKATHAATVAQVDEDKMFYLRSRGFDERGARKMLMFSFFKELLTELDSEASEMIVKRIQKKWEKDFNVK